MDSLLHRATINKRQDENIMVCPIPMGDHNKTKVMISGGSCKTVQTEYCNMPHGRSVCDRGVERNSKQNTTCQKWLNKKCSGIKASMFKANKSVVNVNINSRFI